MSEDATRGRPLLLTPELQRRLCGSVRTGVPMSTSCQLVGVDYSTVRRWLGLGKKENEGVFHDFYLAFTRAKAVAERRLVKTIVTAGPEDWKAAAWLLERRHPDKYGKTTRTEISGPKGKPIQITSGRPLVEMTDEEVRALARGDGTTSARGT
jgi:hypothetical protein